MHPPADQSPAHEGRHIPAPLGLYALAFGALVVAGLVFGEMAEAARRTDPDDIDLHIPAWVRAHADEWPGLTRLFRATTALGNFPMAVVLVVLIAVILLTLHRAKIGGVRAADPFLWLGVTSSGWLLNRTLKLWFQRQRPPDIHWLIEEKGFSFPSGHSAFAGVFFGMLAILLARGSPDRPPWFRVVGVLACLVLAVLVAASRVWLGVHYPTDVIGGLLLGAGWAIAAWLVRSGWARWRHTRKLLRTED
jgi:undecaprenyl-diphosphatase